MKRELRKNSQGRALPPDGSPLSAYPDGSCVRLALDGGEPAWFVITFRIGGAGAPHCRRLTSSPTTVMWSARQGPPRELAADLVVSAACWPARASDGGAAGAECDSLLSAGNVEGDLLLAKAFR